MISARSIALANTLLATSVLAHEPMLTSDAAFAETSPKGAIELTLGIDSRYFVEGRDTLDGDAIATGLVEYSYDGWSAGVWFGESTGSAYDEL